MSRGWLGPLPNVIEAFKVGTGIPYAAYGADLREVIGRGNRPMFTHLLATAWFPQVPGLVERLGGDPPARVADVGCGVGWSSIAIAHAFPTAVVHRLDADDTSVAQARANAQREGIGSRLTFEVRDAADPKLAETFDLVCAFETIHDMSDPVGALRAMRSLRARGGIVLVADERCADGFRVDVDAAERFQRGWSASHSLPLSMVEPPAAATGTLMRAPTLRHYARDAGFRDIDILPIDHDHWRFYLLED